MMRSLCLLVLVLLWARPVHAQTSEVITACVSLRTGVLRIVAEGAACRDTESPLTWGAAAVAAADPTADVGGLVEVRSATQPALGRVVHWHFTTSQSTLTLWKSGYLVTVLLDGQFQRPSTQLLWTGPGCTGPAYIVNPERRLNFVTAPPWVYDAPIVIASVGTQTLFTIAGPSTYAPLGVPLWTELTEGSCTTAGPGDGVQRVWPLTPLDPGVLGWTVTEPFGIGPIDIVE